ncbi:MAG: class I SAM-dependent methyltransferase [Microthrixaceae bacterium]|nr:class I SAM-dependent methyltransferase [Microthrixaceae bacterium]
MDVTHDAAMSPPDPTRYGRSFADVYDDWYHELPTDDLVGFIRSRVPAPAAVLELGVGTGRVALALASAGYEVTGMDSSEQMLERLALNDPQGRVRPLLADAADPNAHPRADVVVAALNMIFNLTTRVAQTNCLRGCAKAIGSDGILVTETIVAARLTERRTELVTRSVEPGRVVLIATDARPETRPGAGAAGEADLGAALVHGSHLEFTDGGVALRPWTVRTISPAHLDELATTAGLELVERFEDFAENPFDDGSRSQVSVYRRAR